MKKNTALMELIEFVNTVRDIQAPASAILFKAQSLLSKETQDIKDAFNEGYREGVGDDEIDPTDISEFDNATDYFNNTFNQ